MSEQSVIALTAGGTGGHVFPAEALAYELKRRGALVLLMTDQRGDKLTANFPYDYKLVMQGASPGRNPVVFVRWAWQVWRTRNASIKFLKQYKCTRVVGFGGYPSVPTLLAARALHLPLVLHEQNAVLGRANRLGAASAKWIASGFSRLDRLPQNLANRHIVTGNPLRPKIIDCLQKTVLKPEGALQLLVLGGSLGARILSEAVPAAIGVLPLALRKRLLVTAQITKDQIPGARAALDAAGVKYELAPFFSNVAEYLSKADLVVARAGASSVSELAAMGKPAILIPLAIAMDDHQSANAGVLKDAGAADIISEQALTPERLAGLLQARLSDLDDLAERARLAKTVAKIDAASSLADLVLEKGKQ